MTSVLPPEICAHICGLIDPALLGPVCRVSRVFRDEGRRLLFQSVDLRLRSCDIKSVRSWCLAVIRHSHLAERVHTLSLQLPNELDPADAARISSAFRKCVNLKSLAVFYDRSLPRTSASAYTWMLENCTFRLTAFTNSYFESGGLREFWDMQPDIRLLSFPEPGFCHLPIDSQLPNLIALRVADDLPLGFSTAINRPFQRIQMPFGSHISSLSRYSATLTTLNILLKLGPTAPIENVAMFVADALPALIHFGISDVSEVSSTRHWEINPTPALEDSFSSRPSFFKCEVGVHHQRVPRRL
ncbi:hypothetical protein C8J57DRAFT_1165542 [Mycena rebaudengoi]|nr:hypothetical protein C8J57DRAFT_1165542 [Mycena rebaudengoi]